MSEVKVNKISPRTNCGTVTLGDSGDTFTIPAGVTLTNSGTATGFGPTGAVSWDTTPKTTTVTAASGVGYFVDTTSGAVTVDLPAGSAGDIVAISDYANTAATNKITIDPNGTDKINGVNQNAEITTNGVAVTLIYVDSTIGWKDVNDATLDVTGIHPFVAATGGTVTCCGDYKIHTFTGPGTFTVTSAGTPAGSNTVDYLVVAGGGGGARGCRVGAGGGGGFRESSGAASGCYSASPLGSGVSALPVSVQGYPITVGGGGAAGSTIGTPGISGSNSIFSTITSTGGGAGGGNEGPGAPPAGFGLNGGSGGGGWHSNRAGGSGNTPPTSPSQGNAGGAGVAVNNAGSGGGGGATAAGAAGTGTVPGTGGIGGAGATTSISASSTSYAGGGGGGGDSGARPGGLGGGGASGNPGVAGTTNTGGGGGGTIDGGDRIGGVGGSGIVIIRYKFQ